MFPVCGVGARAQGLGSSPCSRMLCHSLARVVKQHFWLELGPLLRLPKITVKSPSKPSKPSSRGGLCVRGGAVTRLWDGRCEAKRRGDTPEDRIWAGLGYRQVNKEGSSRTGKTTSMATGINVTDPI